MKIAIASKEHSGFIQAITKGLIHNGDQVFMWNIDTTSLNAVKDKLDPELFIIDSFDELPNSYIDKLNKPVVLLSEIDRPNIIDNITYNISFDDHTIYSDILFSSNFNHTDIEFSLLMDLIIQESNYTIKCVGSQRAPNPYFVCQTDNQSFMSFAKNSSIVITTDNVERDSLLWNNIYAVNFKDFDSNVVKENKLIQSLLHKEKNRIKEYITVSEYVKTMKDCINE